MSDRSSWMAHVDTFVDPDGSDASQAESFGVISKLLLEKRISIKDVVSGIGKYLTNTDNSVRARGVILLGQLLDKLIQTPLEDFTIRSLSQFFTSKLEDWHCLRGALTGSIALLRRTPEVGAVEGNDVRDMAKSALDHLHVQALGLNDRLLSLELLECFLITHGASVSSLGDLLVFGIYAAMEAEKDPRCLLVTFRLVEHLAKLFPDPNGPLADCAEDVFDIVSRYFPVSFTPPPNDQRGISRDDLAAALLKVFSSTPLFAPFCIPILLEKLSSSLQRAKLDSLQYLGFCVASFGPQLMAEYLGAIWLGIKAEIIPPSVKTAAASTTEYNKDSQVYDAALLCLTRIVRAFQRVQDQTKVLASGDLLKLICEDECIDDILKFVENDNSRVSQVTEVPNANVNKKTGPRNDDSSLKENERPLAIGHMLAAVVKASVSSCYILTGKVLKSLILASVGQIAEVELSSDKKQAPGSHPIVKPDSLSFLGLEVTIQIIEAARCVAQEASLSYESSANIVGEKFSKTWLEPMCSMVSILLKVFSQITLEQVWTGDQSKLGVAGLQALASFPASVSPLSEEQLQSVLSILLQTFLDETLHADLKISALGAILVVNNSEDVSSTRSDTNDFSVLNFVIPKLLEAVQQAQTIEFLNPPMEALASIAQSRKIARETVLEGLRQILGTDFSRAMQDCSSDNFVSLKVFRITENLSREIIPCCEKGSNDQTAACHILRDIWRGIEKYSETSVQISEEVLSSLIALNRVTIRSCTEIVQEEILSNALSLLLNYLGDMTSLVQETEEGLSSSSVNYLTQDKGWLVALVASLVVGLLPVVVYPRRDFLLKTFLMSSILETNSLITSITSQATASILNKWKPTSGNGSIDSLDKAIKVAIDEELMTILNQYITAIVKLHNGEYFRTFEKEKIVRAVNAIAWIGKGLAMRGHSRISDVAAVLLMILQAEGSKENLDFTGEHNISPDPDFLIAHSAAEGLGIIVKDNLTCLDKIHNAVVRPLFKQWFFNSMLPPLQEAVRTAGSHSYRIWFFRAFGHILAGIPNGAVLAEGKKVFPLVLEGLSTLCQSPEDSHLLLSTLLTLSAFLTDENHGRTIAAEHVPAMVQRLINLVQYPASLVVRETALQCLAAIAGLPFIRVFPMKPQVMKAISKALDDRKRIVRKEAVRCRRVWVAIS